MILFVPLLITIHIKTTEANDYITELQSQLVAIRLSSLANSIGNMGPDSAIITEVYLPSNLNSLSLNSYESGSEIILNISSNSGSKEIVELIKFPSNQFYLQNPKGMARFEIKWDETDGKKISINRLN